MSINAEQTTADTSLIERLREHAAREAGGTSSEANYDPETLCLETEAADQLEACYKAMSEAEKIISEVCFLHGVPLPEATLGRLRKQP